MNEQFTGWEQKEPIARESDGAIFRRKQAEYFPGGNQTELDKEKGGDKSGLFLGEVQKMLRIK